MSDADPIIQQLEESLASAEFAAKARRKNISRELRRRRQEIAARIQQRQAEILEAARKREETRGLAGSIDSINKVFWAAFEKRQPVLAAKLRPGPVQNDNQTKRRGVT